MSVDVHKAMDQLGFSPRIPLEEGLRRNLEWMREENMVSY
jgi:nucleoside-diphosphate-sugar epimerase